MIAASIRAAGPPHHGRRSLEDILARLDTYGAARDALRRWQLSYDLLVDVKRWLRRHGGLDALSGKLGALGAELEHEIKVAGKQGRYWEDIAAQTRGKEGPFPHLRVANVAETSHHLAMGDAPFDAPKIGYDKYARSVAQKSGLTDGEVAALRTYTSGDYAYINAALAADDAWLKGVLRGDLFPELQGSGPAGSAELTQTVKEAGRHARIAEHGLAKLDVRGPGETWGGETWGSAEEVQRRYEEGHEAPPRALPLHEQEAGEGDRVRKRGEAQHVLMHLNLIAASDLEALSVVRKEWEVLLAPGTELEITSLKPFQLRGEQWWDLEAKQVGVAESQRHG